MEWVPVVIVVVILTGLGIVTGQCHKTCEKILASIRISVNDRVSLIFTLH